MTTTDDRLEARLRAIDARAPGRDDPPGLIQARRRGRFAAPLVMGPILVVAMVATAAGAVLVGTIAEGHPGIENPGQPLAGADMECMSPPEAAAFLASHGYRDVVWQVEAGRVSDGAGGKGPSSTVSQATPPQHGYVIPASVTSDGKLHMVVDQRIGASGVGACFGRPMP